MNKNFEYFLYSDIAMGEKRVKAENTKEIENLVSVCMNQDVLVRNRTSRMCIYLERDLF